MAPDALTTDRAYQSLKAGIVAGRYCPGASFNLQRLAEEFGTSITPIRDAIQRMVGERLLDVLPGGGFHLPMPSAQELRDLYQWHEHLIRHALHGHEPNAAFAQLSVSGNEPGEDLVQATSTFFGLAAAASGNREIMNAVANASDRLSLARRREPLLIKAMAEELEKLESLAASGPTAAIRIAVREYHRRRLRRIDRIASALRE